MLTSLPFNACRLRPPSYFPKPPNHGSVSFLTNLSPGIPIISMDATKKVVCANRQRHLAAAVPASLTCSLELGESLIEGG